MAGVRKLSGELAALRDHVRVATDADVAALGVTGNVVPFLRPRAATESQAPAVVLPSDVARLPQRLSRDRLRLTAFMTLSVAAHAALFWWFWREPQPLASIGVEVISAEIVRGANEHAGTQVDRGDAQQTSRRQDSADPQQTEPQRDAAQKVTEQPQSVQVGAQETAPEQETTLERQADERMPADNAAASREQPAEPKPAIAMVESPVPEMATAAPREIPPDAVDVSLLPQPEEKPLEPKPEPKPAQAARKPVKNAATAKERRRIDAPTRDKPEREAKAIRSEDQLTGSGRGIGRSDRSTNYPGQVVAHLRRYQRSQDQQGSASVTFSLDSGGRVTSVRLARASGIASLDSEVTAMVRRASPFPAPPSGRSESFTVPVIFRFN